MAKPRRTQPAAASCAKRSRNALRIPAAVGERENTAPVELAGDLPPEHHRQRRRLRIAPGADEHVEEIDPGRAHAHEHLAVAGFRIGNARNLELLGPADLP